MTSTGKSRLLPSFYDAFIVTDELYFVLVLKLYGFIFLLISFNFDLRPKLDKLCFSWVV